MSISSSSTSAAVGLTLGALAVQVHDLAQRVRRLESDSGTSPAPAVTEETMDQIREMTERLFPGPITVRSAWDPENPSDNWIVFDVEAKGCYADFRDREFEWYEEVARLSPENQADLRLCVLPKS